MQISRVKIIASIRFKKFHYFKVCIYLLICVCVCVFIYLFISAIMTIGYGLEGRGLIPRLGVFCSPKHPPLIYKADSEVSFTR
jgi:hypothetical protein